MTEEKKAELKTKIFDFINSEDNQDFNYLNEVNPNSCIDNNGGEIESLIQALNNEDIIDYYYEMVTSNVGDSDTDYGIINYWSTTLGLAVLIEQEPSDSFNTLDELVNAIIEWQ